MDGWLMLVLGGLAIAVAAAALIYVRINLVESD